MKSRLIAFLMTLLLAAVSFAQDQKMRIAIMELTPSSGVSADVGSSVSELMRTEMFNTGLFRVVEREQMDKIMKEQALQSTGCTDTECAVQVGKLLAVDRMLVGKISKLGTKFIINARIINVERGEMEFAEKATVESENDLDRAVSQFAQAIAARIRSTKSGGPAFVQPKATVKPSDARPTIAVGSSSGSGDSGIKPVLFWSALGLAAVGGGCNVFGFLQQQGGNIIYAEYLALTDPALTGPIYNDYKSTVGLGNLLNIVGYSCYGVAAGLFVWWMITPDSVPRASVFPTKDGVAVAFAYQF
ncbi:MAG: hypothetical protein HZC28_05680 [Spirochaetes bacterium]|nr:hypothetical protein [Spirochaetota bacterium]